uniref:Uncharacterized protein n=1 Tax=Arundo donax TaxID=35708 RepID=A0A0A9BNE8_ARUDO
MNPNKKMRVVWCK